MFDDPKKELEQLEADIGQAYGEGAISYEDFEALSAKLNDVLDDQEKMLKAHIDNYADPSGTSKSLEKQKHMYETLAGLQDNIRTHILKSDAEGRKMLRESNSKDFTIAAFQKDMAEAASTSGDDDFAIS